MQEEYTGVKKLYIMTSEQQMRYLTQRMGEEELAECACLGEERVLELFREEKLPR